MKRFLASALILAATLEAGTVYLVNDSPYKLRAVVRANDNTFLGEMIINAQNNGQWNDGFNGLPGSLENVRTQTPYRVLWYCLDGSAFSICSYVATGTSVSATYCDGAKQCRGKTRPEGAPPEPGPQPAPQMPLPGQQQPGQQPGQQYYQQPGQQPGQPPPPYTYPQPELQNPPDQYPSDNYYNNY